MMTKTPNEHIRKGHHQADDDQNSELTQKKMSSLVRGRITGTYLVIILLNKKNPSLQAWLF
jgi:hypothetical protein